LAAPEGADKNRQLDQFTGRRTRATYKAFVVYPLWVRIQGFQARLRKDPLTARLDDPTIPRLQSYRRTATMMQLYKSKKED